MSRAQPNPPHPAALWLRGTVLKTRPFFQRFTNTPPIRLAIATRWVAWLARGWPLTTTALAVLVGLLAVRAPIFVAFIGVAGVWVVATDNNRPRAVGLAAIGVAGSIWAAWSDPLLQAVAVGAVATWAVDGLAPLVVSRYRLERWFAEVRRGFPIRYGIMAAKSTRIQGVIDGEQQLTSSARPILDHPALALHARWDGTTAWVRCTVPPGRNATALAEVVGELASSWPRVAHIDLLFGDAHQTYGWLLITFDNPALSTGPSRLRPTSWWPRPTTGGDDQWDPTLETGDGTGQSPPMPGPTPTPHGSDRSSWNWSSTPTSPTNPTSSNTTKPVRSGTGQTPTAGNEPNHPPPPEHPAMHHHTTNEPPVLRLVPAEILDPYPEHVRSLGGVRQHTPPNTHPDRKGAHSVASHRPPPSFAASLKREQRQTRNRRLPVASTMLNLAGQGVLGAAMATGTIAPGIGAVAAVGWMICGLLLIVCQVISQTSHTRPVGDEDSSGVTGVGAVGEAEDGPQGRPQVRATQVPALGNTRILLPSPDQRDVTR